MKPIAVSMGDPCGIGLELVARVWSERRAEAPAFFLVGDSDGLERAAARAGLPKPKLRIAKTFAEIDTGGDALCVLETPLAMEETPGEPDPVNAGAVIASIEQSVAAVRAGAASAIVTLPIAKAVLYDSGFEHPGHTEYLAHLTAADAYAGTRGPVMLLAGASLKVGLVTIHTPFADVRKALTGEAILHAGRVLGEALRRDFGMAEPRIAICGLNPHAG